MGDATGAANGVTSRSKVLPPFPDDIKTAPLVTLYLAKLLSHDVEEHARLFKASKNLGFFYLDMRGCPEGETLLKGKDALFETAEEFHTLPLDEKLKCDYASRGTYAGYKGVGREVIDRLGTRDRNAIYNMPKDDILGINPDPYPVPPLIEAQHDELEKYVKANNAVLQTLFSSLNKSLQLPDGTLNNLHRPTEPSMCHVRFICAPPHPPEDRGVTSLGEHTDFGSLTILFNRVGGLQVQLPGEAKEWVYVRPVEGCAIVNMGDAMVVFTKGLLRSNLHRVITPPGEQADITRYSLVYFCRPENAVVMTPLHGGLLDQVAGEAKDDEPGESSAEWMKRRHLGRKLEYFKGPETWDNARGTEGTRMAV
ncbi:oxidoreductase [Dacryopinax primogenitus]|uniref:Oxidoreductase n=1 Tax=Dacryopinax primogenitus (strain DJM 731) TaxID=1858805 RepID=M5G495_DACPD|nr:oxidoreductase [Dacryopinax primogenitus]EJU03509.1 oxidoreductase [Dacryopinax primogenitus]